MFFFVVDAILFVFIPTWTLGRPRESVHPESHFQLAQKSNILCGGGGGAYSLDAGGLSHFLRTTTHHPFRD